MQTIKPEHFDETENAETFAIRSKVTAVACPGGAQLVDDDGNVTASYADDCYVIEGDDGDHRIVSRYVFDGLYEASDGDYDDGFDGSSDYAPGAPDSGNAAVPTPEQAAALADASHEAATQGGGQAPTQQQDATGQAAGGPTTPTRPAKATQPAKTTPARGGKGGRGGRSKR